MIQADFHVHSKFSDGADSAEDMVREAIRKRYRSIGFSEHSYAPYDLECCIPMNQIKEYLGAIEALRGIYKDQIRIYRGIEQDYYSEADTRPYDYVIGSVHYLKHNNEFGSIDYRPDEFRKMRDEWFAGDVYAMIDEYYRLEADIVSKTNCDLIGHFDLITKLNPKEKLFDELEPHYIAAWKRAADQLLKSGKPFEINTGAIFRRYKEIPYPAPDILIYLRDNGAKFVLSSDAHCLAAVGFNFSETERILNNMDIHLTDFESCRWK